MSSDRELTIVLLVMPGKLVDALPDGSAGDDEPADCAVACAEHRRHCAYVWPHPAHYCSLCEAWDQEPLTPVRVAQLCALGVDVRVQVARG